MASSGGSVSISTAKRRWRTTSSTSSPGSLIRCRGTGRAIRVFCGLEILGADRMKTIRWGIVGCGDVTECKSGPAFGKARNSALVAVMRRDGAKAADYAKRHNVARWYDDGAKLIADPEVDAVYVATPPDSHESYAL